MIIIMQADKRHIETCSPLAGSFNEKMAILAKGCFTLTDEESSTYLADSPIKRITFIGHGDSKMYSCESELSTTTGLTPEGFVNSLETCGLPKTVEIIDLVGCGIGFKLPEEKFSYAEKVQNLLQEKGYNIKVNAISYSNPEGKYSYMLVNMTHSVEVYLLKPEEKIAFDKARKSLNEFIKREYKNLGCKTIDELRRNLLYNQSWGNEEIKKMQKAAQSAEELGDVEFFIDLGVTSNEKLNKFLEAKKLLSEYIKILQKADCAILGDIKNIRTYAEGETIVFDNLQSKIIQLTIIPSLKPKQELPKENITATNPSSENTQSGIMITSPSKLSSSSEETVSDEPKRKAIPAGLPERKSVRRPSVIVTSESKKKTKKRKFIKKNKPSQTSYVDQITEDIFRKVTEKSGTSSTNISTKKEKEKREESNQPSSEEEKKTKQFRKKKGEKKRTQSKSETNTKKRKPKTDSSSKKKGNYGLLFPFESKLSTPEINPSKWTDFSELSETEKQLKQLINAELLTSEEANSLSSTEKERLTHPDAIEVLLVKEITSDFVKSLTEEQWQKCIQNKFNSETIEKIKQEIKNSESQPSKIEEHQQTIVDEANPQGNVNKNQI